MSDAPAPETQELPTVVYVVSTGKMRVAIESVAQMRLNDVAKSAIERFISMGCPPLGTLMEITECSDHADASNPHYVATEKFIFISSSSNQNDQ
jgi:hypothetical protein